MLLLDSNLESLSKFFKVKKKCLCIPEHPESLSKDMYGSKPKTAKVIFWHSDFISVLKKMNQKQLDYLQHKYRILPKGINQGGWGSYIRKDNQGNQNKFKVDLKNQCGPGPERTQQEDSWLVQGQSRFNLRWVPVSCQEYRMQSQE